jgi:hypothetical protein
LLSSDVHRWERSRISGLGYAGAQGRDTSDSIFRCLARTNLGGSNASPTLFVDVNIDPTTCFKHVDRSRLRQLAQKHEYPAATLRLALHSYGWKRRIMSHFDFASSPVQACRGIAAGSAHATSELKLFQLPILSAAAIHRQSTIVHATSIDDLSCVAQGTKRDQVRDDTIASDRFFVRSLHDAGLLLRQTKLSCYVLFPIASSPSSSASLLPTLHMPFGSSEPMRLYARAPTRSVRKLHIVAS